MRVPFPARLVNRLSPHGRGRVAEKAALLFFLLHGFVPMRRPVRALAQTDLLLRRGSLLVLAEVKFRQDEVSGHLALTPPQAVRLQREARRLAARYPVCTIRADVVAVMPMWPFLRHLPAAIPLE